MQSQIEIKYILMFSFVIAFIFMPQKSKSVTICAQTQSDGRLFSNSSDSQAISGCTGHILLDFDLVQSAPYFDLIKVCAKVTTPDSIGNIYYVLASQYACVSGDSVTLKTGLVNPSEIPVSVSLASTDEINFSYIAGTPYLVPNPNGSTAYALGSTISFYNHLTGGEAEPPEPEDPTDTISAIAKSTEEQMDLMLALAMALSFVVGIPTGMKR